MNLRGQVDIAVLMTVSRQDEVEEEEDEHVGWARETRATLTLLQARSSVMTTVGSKAEELIARVRNWFADD
jgi:hypothetical protein